MLISLQQIEDEIRKVLPNRTFSLEDLSRRTPGGLTPNADIDFNFSKFRKEREKLALIVLSYWIEETGCLIRLRFFGEYNLGIPALVACNKTVCLMYLQSSMSDRDFFGNFLPLLRRVGQDLRLVYREPRKARRKIRRRGYSDHGTLRSSSEWKPKTDWSLTDLQNQIEEEREVDRDTLLFLEGFLE
jgi:hypothetical protein